MKTLKSRIRYFHGSQIPKCVMGSFAIAERMLHDCSIEEIYLSKLAS